MAAEIRDYNPSTDADRVADFFNLNRYGPARDGSILTGFELNLVLAERGVHLFLVAEDRGRIIGTIGYLRVSGRRVSRDDELFAGMFVIDPGYRAGFLAGRLFTSSFTRLLEDGITSLRVEVNPANVKAFPLYIRVGFRSAATHPQPDQDGYIELVSHLPGVVSRLLHELASDVPLSDVFASFSWRSMAGGRNRSLSHGVTILDDGDVLVEYDFTVRGESILVNVRMDDGAHVSTVINGVIAELPAAPTERPATGRTAAANGSIKVGEYAIELGSDGTVSVRHRSYFGPVYRDALSSVIGSPSAWRRPPSNSPLVTERQDGWLIDWQVDGVRMQKAITIEGNVVSVVVRSSSSYGLVAEPWSSIRGALVRCYVGDDEQFQSPNVPGLWPPDIVDFEASHAVEPFVPHLQTVVEEPVSGVRLEFEWQQVDSLRVEGQTLGRGTTSGSELRYSLTLSKASVNNHGSIDEASNNHPEGIAWNRDSPGGQAIDASATLAGAWSSEIRGGQKAVQARRGTTSELVVAPEHGIATWRVEGHDVLSSPFPSARKLGPLDNWATGLWVTVQGGREDVEHGVGWGGFPRVANNSGLAIDGPSWSVDGQDDSLSQLQLNLIGGDASLSGVEIVAHLTPKIFGSTVFIPASPTGWWALERTGRRWFCFARAVRIPLSGDRVLSIAASTDTDEILVRSSSDSFLVSLISRSNPSGSSWLLSVETQEAN
ncbi:GNAT family N-acetyltransferase [Agreia bicolorata]|uniref:GNAT family N-acetyltransferase n=1 Tax=Agreia bicolorata TaxID=110935 RepID=UPI0006975C83|nr:GNAT family N-acetyltransferase [Agreia bicolorata]